jgi:hypothetical protein
VYCRSWEGSRPEVCGRNYCGPQPVEDIEDIAERAERGEDISAHFTKTFVAKQRVNIDFPLALLREIDAECGRIGITRQAWIKMVCAEHLTRAQTPHME